MFGNQRGEGERVTDAEEDNQRMDVLTFGIVLIAAMMLLAVGAVETRSAWRRAHPQRVTPELIAGLAEGAHSVGPADARVQIIVHYNYDCGFCRTFQATLDSLRKIYPEDVTIRYATLGGASEPALATECAADQGAFESFHAAMYASLRRRNAALAWPDAKRATPLTNPEEFDRCLSTKRFAEKLDRQNAIAGRLGVTATPTSLVNGRVLIGAVELKVIERIVRSELARSPIPRANVPPYKDRGD